MSSDLVQFPNPAEVWIDDVYMGVVLKMVDTDDPPTITRKIGRHTFRFTGFPRARAKWEAWMDRCEAAFNVRRILRKEV